MPPCDALQPLTASERADFQQRYSERLARVKAKTDDVFAFKPVKAPAGKQCTKI